MRIEETFNEIVKQLGEKDNVDELISSLIDDLKKYLIKVYGKDKARNLVHNLYMKF